MQAELFRQFGLDALVFGDVGADGHELPRFALIIEERNDGGSHPEEAAVFRAILDLAVPGAAARDGAPKSRKNSREW